jgi:predicted transcriptional regulator
MARPRSTQLTEHELSIMKILWQQSPLSVAEILERLPRTPKPAYTSLLTVVRTLEQKGHIAHAKESKAHLYYPTLRKHVYQRRELQRLVRGLFDGDAFALAVNVIKSEPLDEEELAELKQLLDKR